MTDNTENPTGEIASEIARIRELAIEEQPNAFGALRDQLEAMLNDVSGVSAGQQ